MAGASNKNSLSNSKKIYLTSKGLLAIQQELKYLKSVKKEEIANLISHAVEMGNLEESAEYDAAITEQSIVGDRIIQLEQIIRDAKIIKDGLQQDFVTIGSTVKLKMDRNIEEFTIVGSIEANPAKKMISNESPVGSALLGCKVGEEAQVTTPQYTYRCKILEIR